MKLCIQNKCIISDHVTVYSLIAINDSIANVGEIQSTNEIETTATARCFNSFILRFPYPTMRYFGRLSRMNRIDT